MSEEIPGEDSLDSVKRKDPIPYFLEGSEKFCPLDIEISDKLGDSLIRQIFGEKVSNQLKVATLNGHKDIGYKLGNGLYIARKAENPDRTTSLINLQLQKLSTLRPDHDPKYLPFFGLSVPRVFKGYFLVLDREMQYNPKFFICKPESDLKKVLKEDIASRNRISTHLGGPMWGIAHELKLERSKLMLCIRADKADIMRKHEERYLAYIEAVKNAEENEM